MIKRSLLLTGCLIFILVQASTGQISGSFYGGSGATKIGIGYDFSPRFWVDLRMYGGVWSDAFTPELTTNFNFVKKEIHDVYTGLGVSVNGVNSIFVPIGYRVRPFEKLRALALIVEAEPMYNVDEEDVFFAVFVGVRYKFKAAEK